MTDKSYKTRTLSDFPLLIGEILWRNGRRIIQQTKRRSLFLVLGKTFGMRIPQRLGGPNN
jgi:hypothetical protein